MTAPTSMWPPLRHLAARAPADAFASCRTLRLWAERSGDSLNCVRWTQEVLEGVLLLKAADSRMLRWAGAPANHRLALLAEDRVEAVIGELREMNLRMARLGLTEPVDATRLFMDRL